MRIDSNIYNIDNLKDEDKYAVMLLRKVTYDLDNVVEIETNNESTLEKVVREIREDCVEDCKSRIYQFIDEFIVARIDSYEE